VVIGERVEEVVGESRPSLILGEGGCVERAIQPKLLTDSNRLSNPSPRTVVVPALARRSPMPAKSDVGRTGSAASEPTNGSDVSSRHEEVAEETTSQLEVFVVRRTGNNSRIGNFSASEAVGEGSTRQPLGVRLKSGDEVA